MSDTETPAKLNSPLSTEAFKQLHEACRHAFGLYVGWFTFFITLNFIALGWLAKGGTEKPDPLIVKKIAMALILFIALGITSGFSVVFHARKARGLLAAGFASTNESESVTRASLPAHLYTLNIGLMTIALLALLFVWVGFLMMPPNKSLHRTAASPSVFGLSNVGLSADVHHRAAVGELGRSAAWSTDESF